MTMAGFPKLPTPSWGEDTRGLTRGRIVIASNSLTEPAVRRETSGVPCRGRRR
jgi:hypothetical protein